MSHQWRHKCKAWLSECLSEGCLRRMAIVVSSSFMRLPPEWERPFALPAYLTLNQHGYPTIRSLFDEVIGRNDKQDHQA